MRSVVVLLIMLSLIGKNESFVLRSSFSRFLLPRSSTTSKSPLPLPPSPSLHSIKSARFLSLLSSLSLSSSTPSSPFLPYDVNNQMSGIPKSYDPASYESNIYTWWEKSGCFKPDAKYGSSTAALGSSKKPYVIPMPPPNVTGRLHMGHAIFVSIQDALARFHRMRGRPTLWTPGTDHAGIATQLQVEKMLAKENTSREEIGREKFLERVWEYKREQGGHITSQLRSLGASADWSRERFTMDEDMNAAVVEAFVRLHDKGLIYRGEYMVNWAPLLKTAVSDLEVDYVEEVGKLYYFKYAVDGASKETFLPVATTRPETIFGDSAVCVHPDDERFKHLIGKMAVVPTLGRLIPIIADSYVDMEFGTGALKVTPGHDTNDYSLGKKHALEMINIMNKDATLNANAGIYANLDRFEARERVWEDMVKSGQVIKAVDHAQRVPRSQRGGEVIEPMLSSQWFVKTEGMGKKALDAVKNGEIKIIPSRFEKVWDSWLSGVHDWCISRQLWWGHRIPVYYLNGSETDYVVARSMEEARLKAKSLGYDLSVTVITQEEDVLDTWFSSGLWPFATVGWPPQQHGDGNGNENGSEFARFYPSTCLETGYDILFFWVARMAMMGIELTGKAPFDVVYLHGLVRAADGSKMSKSKGNVVDPIDAVGKYGADALRYSLLTGVTPGQDIPLNMEKVEANRNFANKLFNICKFVVDNALRPVRGECGEYEEYAVGRSGNGFSEEEFAALELPEKWIVSKCHRVVNGVTADIENYQLAEGGRKIYEFLWDDFADWYIEISKTRLYEANGGEGDGTGAGAGAAKVSRKVLVYVLDRSLKMLHPYMPFVTESLWHHLPRKGVGVGEGGRVADSLMLADWPLMEGEALCEDAECEVKFAMFQVLVKSVRNARNEYNVEPGKRIAAVVVVGSSSGGGGEAETEMLRREVNSLILLARLDADKVEIVGGDCEEGRRLLEGEGDQQHVRLAVSSGIDVFLPLSGLIDEAKERARLERQLEKLGKEIEKLSSRLSVKGFAGKAPEAVVSKARAELLEMENQARKVNESLSFMAIGKGGGRGLLNK